MDINQIILSAVLLVMVVMFIWGRFRYDAVALTSLAVLVVLGFVPAKEAFVGFGHPAVITVALVLLISKGLEASGLIGKIGNLLQKIANSEFQFLVILMGIAVILSSFMNNIGAMAILLPLTISVCQKMDWHPAKFLMPLAFACILGGMNTLIGTPPNIIISDYAYQQTGSEFNFFDFSKVGLLITISGVLFVAFLGNKLLELREIPNNEPLINMKGYMFEVEVNKGSSSIGLTLFKFKKQAGEDIEIMGVISETGSIRKVKNNMRIKEGQILVIKSPPDEIGKILSLFDFSIPEDLHSFDETDLEEIEVLISPGSRLIGRNYDYFQKLAFEELNLLGLWRKGTKYRTRLTRETEGTQTRQTRETEGAQQRLGIETTGAQERLRLGTAGQEQRLTIGKTGEEERAGISRRAQEQRATDLQQEMFRRYKENRDFEQARGSYRV